MASSPLALADAAEDDEFSMGSLLRIAAWGTFAAASLTAAVLAGFSNVGSKRMTVALAAIAGHGATTAPQVAAVPVAQRSTLDDSERRVLSEQVRLLAAERQQLVTRIAALEHSIEDVTGSIRREQAEREAVVEHEPAAVAATPETAAAAAAAPPETEAPVAIPPPGWQAQIALAPLPELETVKPSAPAPAEAAPRATTAQPAPVRPPEPRRSPAAFGIDLGGGTSVDRLRMLWNSVRGGQPRLVAGLHPVVRTHDRATPGQRAELRLVAGPLASAEQAARLCAAFNSAGVPCEPTVFGGQRMTLR